MKNKQTGLARQYLAELRKYLKKGAGGSLKPARALGQKAIKLGLETLDMARLHDIALFALPPARQGQEDINALARRLGRSVAPSTKGPEQVTVARARIFFAEALTPIEQTHRGARLASTNLNQMILALSQQTRELAASNEELKKEIVQRKTVEESLRTSELTSSRLLEKSRQMQEELRHLSRKLLTVQEEERRQISRELHDVVAQTLTGINVRLAALKAESAASTKELQRKIGSTQRLVARSVDVIHRFARELRPTVLDDLGLIPALQSHIKSFTKQSEVRVSLKTFADLEKMDGDKRTVLFRVAQEALTNVARHAKASRADIRIREAKGIIGMEIKDDGKGFAVDGPSGGKRSTRLGLLGMRERVEMVGGTFCVESAPGRHTTVRVEIPVSKKGTTNKAAPKKSAPNSTLKCL